MYDSQNSLIANYINPIIGDMKVQDITTWVVDKYIQTLQKTPAVNTRTHHAKTEFVTNATIEKIIKLLRCAFKQAVRWELVAKNPFDNVVLPKVEYKKRDIWTADMIRTALDPCTDSKLYVAMNLAFACSLRMGEILGLTWSNVHISDEDIADDNAYVYIDKELARASKRAIEMLGQKGHLPYVHAAVSQHQHQDHLEKAQDRFPVSARCGCPRPWLISCGNGSPRKTSFGRCSVTSIRTTTWWWRWPMARPL